MEDPIDSRARYQAQLSQPARERSDKRVRWMLYGFVFFILAVLGLYGGNWFLKSDWNIWRDRVGDSIVINVQQGDPHTARTALIQAMKDSPNDPAVLRAWALFNKSFGGPATDRITALKKLSDLGQATPEELVDLAAAHLDNQEFDQGGRVFESIPEAGRQSVAAVEVRARLARAAGNSKESLEISRAAYEQDQENPQSQLKLALLRLTEPFPENQAEGVATLHKLAGEPTVVGMQAIEALASHASLTAAEANQLMEQANSNPSVTPRQRYLVLSAVTRTQPEKKASLLLGEVAKANNYGPEALAELARWLAREGEQQTLLTIIPQEKALRDPGLFKVYADSLIQIKQWDTLQTLLSGRSLLPVSKSYASLLKGYLAASQSDLATATTHMQAACRQAVSEQNAEIVFKSAAWSADQAVWDTAIEGFTWLASADPKYTRLSLELLYQAALGKRDSLLMAHTAARMADEQAASPQSIQRLIYLRLMLGEEMETTPTLHQRYAHLPGTNEQATMDLFLAALASYRLGDAKGSADKLLQIENLGLLPPGQRAVAAALFRQAGQQEKAIRLAQSIHAALLIPEEWYLVAKADLIDVLKH